MNNNDHYVPQFLLRRFCDLDGYLHVLDKWDNRSFKSATRNVASERGFYDLKFDNGIISFEPLLCAFENAALEALNAIVERKTLSVLAEADHVNIAYFLGIQTLRTRAQRENLKQMDLAMREALALKGVLNEALPDNFYRTEEEVKSDSIMQLRLAEIFAPHFLMKCWCLNTPHNGTKFVVSDHPVVCRNYYDPTSFMGNNGIASEGIQIYLPLSPDLILCLLCPTLVEPFRLKQKVLDTPIPILNAIDTGNPFVIPSESVTYCNSLQVAYSERFVFSCNGDFDLANKMLSKNPELRKPTRVNAQ